MPDLRPTGSAIRDRIFDLARRFVGTHAFLDLFGGSGIMGITAFSEGFSPVHIFESHPLIRQQLQDQLTQLAIDAKVGVHYEDVRSCAIQPPWFAYVDPPFRDCSAYEKAFSALRALPHHAENVILSESEIELPVDLAGFERMDVRRAGRIILSIYRPHT